MQHDEFLAKLFEKSIDKTECRYSLVLPRKQEHRSFLGDARSGRLCDGSACPGPQHDMAHRRVRGGHMVEAVQFLHLSAQRRAHDEPNDELDALGAGLAQIFEPG